MKKIKVLVFGIWRNDKIFYNLLISKSLNDGASVKLIIVYYKSIILLLEYNQTLYSYAVLPTPLKHYVLSNLSKENCGLLSMIWICLWYDMHENVPSFIDCNYGIFLLAVYHFNEDIFSCCRFYGNLLRVAAGVTVLKWSTWNICEI